MNTLPTLPHDADRLPAPATASPAPSRRLKYHTPTVDAVRVRWAKLKRKIGNGSSPDGSLGEPTDSSSTSGGSLAPGGRKSTNEKDGGMEDAEGAVDEVVVENVDSPEMWNKLQLGSVTEGNKAGGGTQQGVTTGVETSAPHVSDESSARHTQFEFDGKFGSFANWWRWRVFPVIEYFFCAAYHDKETEEAYQKELWWSSKSTAIFGSCFLVFNWVLSISTLPQPWDEWNRVQNYILAPLLTVPMVFMAALNVPRKQKLLWQWYVLISVWVAASANVLDIKLCHFYVLGMQHCGNKDFMATMYYVAALPVVGLFALGQTRFFTTCGMLWWLIFTSATIFPDNISFIKNVLNVALYLGFILWMHYRKELADRRMYLMRSELKTQFRAKQKAQINERKTMDSKKRFMSYIFHEVRVPLNTALLAVQNLEGANVFDRNSEQAVEYSALEGSLQMMSQVLNDVLDFGRMERGGFSTVSRPFSFHLVMKSIFLPLGLDAAARGLSLETNLDPRIDEVAMRSALSPGEEWDGLIAEGGGLVMGDEMRLRQVINNLTNNAAKFTPRGGSITITTRLVFPLEPYPHYNDDSTEPSPGEPAGSTPGSARGSLRGSFNHTIASGGLSMNRLRAHEDKTAPFDRVLVARIEVKDTGVGIRRADMAENRLFSAYVQTEIGRHQGGKGTGLGLSLVRQIVALSGGRLGVKSRVGEGSTFWIEMPFRVGPQTRQTDHLEPHRRINAALDKGLAMPSLSSVGSQQPGTIGSLLQKERGLGIRNEPNSNLKNIEEHLKVESTTPAGETYDSSQTTLTNHPLQQSSESSEVSVATSTSLAVEVRPSAATYNSDSSSGSTTAFSPSTTSSTQQLRRDSISSVAHSSTLAPPTLSNSMSMSSASGRKVLRPLEFAAGPLSVLVVDDDALTRKLMSRMMVRLGCNVEMAENGKIALDMLLHEGEEMQATQARKRYDITFLDNQMPVASGLEVVKKLRGLGRDDLVVGITANALLSDQEEYRARGANAVLTKPVLEADLRRFLVIADELRTVARNSSPAPRVIPLPSPSPYDPPADLH